MRQNHLVLDGWKVFRFSSDDITSKPRRCQQFVLHMMGDLYGDAEKLEFEHMSLKEREVIKFVASSIEPVTPKQLAEYLDIHPENARTWLYRLYEKKLLKSGSASTSRVRSYILDATGKQLFK